MGLIVGSGRSLGGGKGNPLQYSCLKNPMDRRACQATVQRVTVRHDSDGAQTPWIKISKLDLRFPSWLNWLRIHLQCRRPGFNPWVGKIPWRRAWQPTPALLLGESPWTEEPSGLQSMGSQRIRHNWANKLDLTQTGSQVEFPFHPYHIFSFGFKL